MLHEMLQDVRYAARTLRQSPAFAATTVLTLAVGLGLITIAFAILNAYAVRPFAVRDPFHLYTVVWSTQHARGATFSWRDYEQLRGRHDLFEDAMVSRVQVVSSEGRKLQTEFVSGNYFDMLGVRMLRGRALSEADARAPGGDPVAVLSDQAWARFYDCDPAVLGRTINLNGHPFIIVGVMAARVRRASTRRRTTCGCRSRCMRRCSGRTCSVLRTWTRSATLASSHA